MEKIVASVDADLADLIPGYLANRINDLAVICNSLGAEDYDTIRRLAHRMKGSGGGYGFDGITSIGAAMEQAAVQKNSGEIKRQVQVLEDYLDKVEITYV
ncbi:MAG: Hpt domain-containing protein [Eubacteriales bacterium]|jgi:HPt (histidine-containing phosphotransfer) domain-containing protein|nr:Hpt domain-containing protein [Eubacteriales bacterium]